MRICTNCGRILDDDEIFCRVCNSDMILNTEGDTTSDDTIKKDIAFLYGEEKEEDDVQVAAASGSVDASPAEESADDMSCAAETDLSPEESDPGDEMTVEEPDSESSVSADEPADTAAEEDQNDHSVFDFTAADLEAISPLSDTEETVFAISEDNTEEETHDTESDTDAIENDSPEAADVEEEEVPAAAEPEHPDAFPEAVESSEDVSNAEEAAETSSESDKIKIISVKAPSNEKIKTYNSSRVAAVIMALLSLIAVISATFMIVIPLINSRRQDEAAKTDAYMQFLNGKWLSETFIYSGKEFPSCEILELASDGTFHTSIWTSPDDRKTYDPETWTLTAEQSGQYHLELDTSSLRVSYTDSDGNVMVYRRYILKLDTQALTLREYYNEKMTDYYDVIFSRIENGD